MSSRRKPGSINIGVPHRAGGGYHTGTPRGTAPVHRTQSKELNPYEQKRTLVPRKDGARLNTELKETISKVYQNLTLTQGG
jgi:hypothetical protein